MRELYYSDVFPGHKWDELSSQQKVRAWEAFIKKYGQCDVAEFSESTTQQFKELIPGVIRGEDIDIGKVEIKYDRPRTMDLSYALKMLRFVNPPLDGEREKQWMLRVFIPVIEKMYGKSFAEEVSNEVVAIYN
jgi:hypothetical protein